MARTPDGRTLNKDGCEFGRVNRLQITALQQGQTDIMLGIKEVREKNVEMFNHFTERYEKMFKETANRMPTWVTIVGSIGGILLGGLIVWAVTH